MKVNIFLFLIIIIYSCTHDNSDLPLVDKVSNQIIFQTAGELKNEKQLFISGFGGGAVDGLNKLSIFFYCYKNLSLQEKRELIVFVTEKFLQNVNENKEIRSYMKGFPFTSSNIEISIEFKKHFFRPSVKEISLVAIHQNKIAYYNHDNDEKFLNEVFSETFEKAKEKLITK